MDAADFAASAPHHIPAMSAGCECWRCPMANSGQGPVPPTLPPEDREIGFLVVGEAPGHLEVEEGKTLIGPSGREIRRALGAAGLNPAQVSYANALWCRPPRGDLDDYLRDLRRQVRNAKKQGGFASDEEKTFVNPVDCCRPALTRTLQRSRYAFLMGGASLGAAGFSKASIMKLRGTPVQVPNGPAAMPILHSAFVLRDNGRAFRPIFYRDVAKGVRLAYGGTTWRDPAYWIATQPEHIANFIEAHRGEQLLAVDTETDGIDPWTCGLRRIGIGTRDNVLIWSPQSVDGHRMLDDQTYQACHAVLRAFFAAPPTRLVFHNYYGFDSIVLNHHGLTVNDDAVLCTLIAHRIGATSELPHGLDFLGSVFTDAPRWKDDVKHTDTKDDGTLDRYLSFDVSVTAQAAPWVMTGLEQSQQQHIFWTDTRLSQIARSMSAVGALLDGRKQRKFAEEYQEKADRLLAEFQALAGSPVNPRSPLQVANLLYGQMKLPVTAYTETGEPSTAEPALLAALPKAGDRGQSIIKALLGYREADKLLGTYTGRLLVQDGVLQLVDGPPIHPDGRLRITWKVGHAATGRWSSGDPMNLQNVPKKLRAMFVPAPGHVYVGADYSALELRILALLSGDDILIEAFRAFDAGEGPDVHIVNACTLFRCTPKEVTDEVRNFVKRFVYGLSYGAMAPKIYETLSLLRDDNLRPLFPHITLSEVERVYNVWWEAHPKILAWQEGLFTFWRRHGFLATKLHGRRRYFLAGENHEEQKNFPIQGYAADLQNDAVLTFNRLFPPNFAERTGLIYQVHDQLVAECRADDAERVKQIMEYSMRRKIDGMLFPAAAKSGNDWKEVS